MYVSPNVKSKKELRWRLSQGETIRVFSPGPFSCPENGNISVEGPHYPQPHRWYATVSVKDGVVQKVTG